MRQTGLAAVKRGRRSRLGQRSNPRRSSTRSLRLHIAAQTCTGGHIPSSREASAVSMSSLFALENGHPQDCRGGVTAKAREKSALTATRPDLPARVKIICVACSMHKGIHSGSMPVEPIAPSELIERAPVYRADRIEMAPRQHIQPLFHEQSELSAPAHYTPHFFRPFRSEIKACLR